MKIKKKVVIMSSAIGGTLLIGPPAVAFLGFIDSPLIRLADEYLFGGVVETAEELFNLGEEASGYVEEVFNSNGITVVESLLGNARNTCSGSDVPLEICNDIALDGGSIIEAMENNEGILGLPIPENYQQEMVDILLDSTEEPSWGYVSNPSVIADDVKHAGDRGLALLNSNTILSVQGQEDMKKRIETNETIARTSMEIGTQALRTRNERKLLRMMALMEAQQTILQQSQANTAEMSRVDQQITNLNLANISKTLDKEQTEKQVEKRVVTDGLIRAVNGLGMY